MAYRKTPAVEQKLIAVRAGLLHAATALVAEHGYGGCSIAKVAARAGVGTGTVYRYFPNKGELFAEVFRAACTREIAAATTAGADTAHSTGSYTESIAASVETFAARALQAPTLAYALMAEPVDPLVDVERLAFREAYRDAFAAGITAAIDAGELPEQDANTTAACIVGAIGEALVLPLARGTAGPNVVPALITFTLRALGSSEMRSSFEMHNSFERRSSTVTPNRSSS